MRFLVALATLAACDAGGRTSPAPVASLPVVAPAVVVPSGAPAVAVPPSPRAPDDEPRIALSSLVLPIVPMESTRRVRTNPYVDDALATASHGGNNDPAQVVSGVLAVAADPSSVPARFAEACLLAQEGQHALARSVMTAVHEANCATCSDALLELRNDVCRFDAATKQLADGVKPSPVRAAATAILASLNSGDAASIETYLDGGSIVLTSTCSVCDEDVVRDSKHTATTFKAYVRDADKRSSDAQTYNAPVFMFCDTQCCTGPTGYLNHSASFVTDVCFRGGAKAPTLASIGTLDG